MVSGYYRLRWRFFFIQLFTLLCLPAVQALPAPGETSLIEKPISKPRTAEISASLDGEIEGRWVHFAQGISEITAAAVSPLLVVSVIGANRYMHTPEADRRKLPFFCNPVLWGTGLLLLLLCFLKDAVGIVVPSILKKPFDMLELFENKLSALVASTLFVPTVAWQMMQHFGPTAQSLNMPFDVHFASAVPSLGAAFDLRWLLVLAAVTSFFTVFLTAHIVNVLVAICPISLIDSMLKASRNAILALIVVSSAINPFLGVVVSLLLLLVATMIAGRAFRLAVFGALLALDGLLFWRKMNREDFASARVFIVDPISGIPARTYGRLTFGEEGDFRFQYRPWLLFRKREIVLPVGIPVLRRDVLFVSLLLRFESGKEARVVEFLPRYRPHVEALAGHYRVSEIRDGAVVGGFKALWKWILEMADSKATRAV